MKRDRLSIIFEILTIIKKQGNQIKPTPLMRYANLSFRSFEQYSQELLEKGLIQEEVDKKGNKYFVVTDRGFRYLEKFDYIKQFIDEFSL